MKELLHQFVDIVVGLVGDWGYTGIFVLMTVESSFIPFPSEVILIPAGVAIKQGLMNPYYALLAGTCGSLAGALINYYLAFFLGRKLVLKYGKYLFLKEEKFLVVEQKVLDHGIFVTFVGRLIFGVRQLISIPAGIVKMPILPFSIFTALGAGIWSAILLSLGYVLGGEEDVFAKAKLIAYWILPFVIILSIAYYYWCSPKKGPQAS